MLGRARRAGAARPSSSSASRCGAIPALAAEIAAAGHTHRAARRPPPQPAARAAAARSRDDLDRGAATIAEATASPRRSIARRTGSSARPACAMREAGWRAVLWSRWGRDWRADRDPRHRGQGDRGPRSRRRVLLHDADHYGAGGSCRAHGRGTPAHARGRASARPDRAGRALGLGLALDRAPGAHQPQRHRRERDAETGPPTPSSTETTSGRLEVEQRATSRAPAWRSGRRRPPPAPGDDGTLPDGVDVQARGQEEAEADGEVMPTVRASPSPCPRGARPPGRRRSRRRRRRTGRPAARRGRSLQRRRRAARGRDRRCGHRHRGRCSRVIAVPRRCWPRCHVDVAAQALRERRARPPSPARRAARSPHTSTPPKSAGAGLGVHDARRRRRARARCSAISRIVTSSSPTRL